MVKKTVLISALPVLLIVAYLVAMLVNPTWVNQQCNRTMSYENIQLCYVLAPFPGMD